jgi:hypothetical protein
MHERAADPPGAAGATSDGEGEGVLGPGCRKAAVEQRPVTKPRVRHMSASFTIIEKSDQTLISGP